MDLYTCTRHYFAWYPWNALRLEPHEIALQLGHRDGGDLVRKQCGHADGDRPPADPRGVAKAPAAPVSLDSRRTRS
jgi:hypothetical protein